MCCRIALTFLVVLLEAVVPPARSQSTSDIAHILANHPNCFYKGFQYTPDIAGTNTQAANMQECQSKCREIEACKVFAYFPYTRDCYFGDVNARMVESTSGAISGYAVCPAPTQTPPERCRTELPNDGFPGLNPSASQAAWPGGRQPWSLECWPKNWTGGYIPCRKVQVLEDTNNKWPGKCIGLVRQEGSAYVTADPNTKSACQQDCMQNPLCASWQTGFYGKCWQGVGENCYVRENFNPVGAQRFQHGEVRKLMDLAGWQIVGLHQVFNNADDYFLQDADAVNACKAHCYSDIRCQYWQYSTVYGCYVEDSTKEYSPPYPLTLDWAYRSTAFALSCIAGEFVQHYCPEQMTTAFPTEAPESISTCMRRGIRYNPADMPFQDRTVEPSPASCQARCSQTVGCAHFTYWPDGGCRLQAEDATEVMAEDFRVISGPQSCDAEPAITNWLTSEGQEALQGDLPGPNIHPDMVPLSQHDNDISGIIPGSLAAMRFAELRLTISNLDSNSLTVVERRQLKQKYTSALAQMLSMPINEIKDRPSGDPATVKLVPQPPSSSQLRAYVPNRPQGSTDVRRLQALLQSSRLAEQLKSATEASLGPGHGAIRGELEVVNPTVQLAAVELGPTAAPLKETDCDFWCMYWPMVLGCGFLAAVGGLLAAFLLSKPQKGSSTRKVRGLLTNDAEASSYQGSAYQDSGCGSDWDSRASDTEEHDASIWASEPSWDERPRRSQPPRTDTDVSLGDIYSQSRGDTIFEA